MVVGDVVVTDDRRGAAEDLARQNGVTPEEILESPLVLIGDAEAMIEHLQACRERFGFSYVVVTEPNLEKLAPVVARLAGT